MPREKRDFEGRGVMELSQSSYTIVHLLEGDAAVFQQNMLYDLAARYDLDESITREPPAHITLKYKFRADEKQINLVVNSLANFCQNREGATYRIDGFDYFQNESGIPTAVFLNIIETPELRDIQREFVTILKEFKWMSWKPFDGVVMHFHATVALLDATSDFESIWQEVTRHKVEHKMAFNNIAILKIVDGKWQVFRRFGLNG